LRCFLLPTEDGPQRRLGCDDAAAPGMVSGHEVANLIRQSGFPPSQCLSLVQPCFVVSPRVKTKAVQAVPALLMVPGVPFRACICRMTKRQPRCAQQWGLNATGGR
jgi:hypothetical protein